eukprot:8762794-Pyramimonas_sp.AAC.1
MLESNAEGESKQSGALDRRWWRAHPINGCMAAARSAAPLPGTGPHCAGPKALGAAQTTGSAIDMQGHWDRWSETRVPRLLPR